MTQESTGSIRQHFQHKTTRLARHKKAQKYAETLRAELFLRQGAWPKNTVLPPHPSLHEQSCRSQACRSQHKASAADRCPAENTPRLCSCCYLAGTDSCRLALNTKSADPSQGECAREAEHCAMHSFGYVWDRTSEALPGSAGFGRKRS